jgi:hypothetical protein
MTAATAADCDRSRNLLFLSTPTLWPAWPFLPLMRRKPGQEEEYGLLYDALHVSNKTGYSATVLLCNLFSVPRDETAFLAMPKETFDSPEEIFDAGWRVD